MAPTTRGRRAGLGGSCRLGALPLLDPHRGGIPQAKARGVGQRIGASASDHRPQPVELLDLARGHRHHPLRGAGGERRAQGALVGRDHRRAWRANLGGAGSGCGRGELAVSDGGRLGRGRAREHRARRRQPADRPKARPAGRGAPLGAGGVPGPGRRRGRGRLERSQLGRGVAQRSTGHVGPAGEANHGQPTRAGRLDRTLGSGAVRARLGADLGQEAALTLARGAQALLGHPRGAGAG